MMMIDIIMTYQLEMLRISPIRIFLFAVLLMALLNAAARNSWNSF